MDGWSPWSKDSFVAGVPAEKSGGSFLDSGTAASSGRENKGTLGRSVGPFPENLHSEDYCAPPPFYVASGEGKRGLRDWNLWR